MNELQTVHDFHWNYKASLLVYKNMTTEAEVLQMRLWVIDVGEPLHHVDRLMSQVFITADSFDFAR